MADILVQNAIDKVASAVAGGAGKIDYRTVFNGLSMKQKVKEIIDANPGTGPYEVGSGGAKLCDLTDHCYMSLCVCPYAGSGTACGSVYIGNGSNKWTDGTILGTGGSTPSVSDIRTAITNLDKTIEAVYDISNTVVQRDIYYAYLELRADYYAGNNTTLKQEWYGVDLPATPGQPLSSVNRTKVCGTYWKCGEGATCTWTVPVGASQAKFQAWGAGQGTNPACCCGGANFGFNGAYSEITIKVTPGDQYTICAGCACCRWCCSNDYPSYGCMSGVTGNGICCFKADGAYCEHQECHSQNWLRVNSSAPGMPGAACRRHQNPYCTTSGSCYCSYGGWCFSNSCSTCGVYPIMIDCCNYITYCSCATTACKVVDGVENGFRGMGGGTCYDTNNYGWYTRPPHLDADTGLHFGCQVGCSCASVSSNCCCGGCNGTGWTWHPGFGGAYTHTMGGNNTHKGDVGKAGMVIVSWN